MYDVQNYTPGEGYAEPGAVEPVESGAPAPAAPAPAAQERVKTAENWRAQFGGARQQQQPAATAQDQEQAQQSEGAEEAAPVESELQPSHEPYELRMPDFLPLKEVTDERQTLFDDWRHVAPACDVDSNAAQGLVDAAVDAATQLRYDAPEDADGARVEMARLFGEESAKNIVARAQKYVREHDAEGLLSEYLDTSGLGNDPAVLVALAFAQGNWFSKGATPAWARAELDKVMASKEYQSSDKLAVLKTQVLSRIAYRDAAGPEDQLAAAARAQLASKSTSAAPASKPAASAAPAANTAPQSDADARKELAGLMKNGSALYSTTHPDHANAVRRFHELARRVK
jgi:hypothetical protein